MATLQTLNQYGEQMEEFCYSLRSKYGGSFFPQQYPQGLEVRGEFYTQNMSVIRYLARVTAQGISIELYAPDGSMLYTTKIDGNINKHEALNRKITRLVKPTR